MNTWLEVRLQDTLGAFSLDISLELGRAVGVLFGPSGADKSATLRGLAGLRHPHGGSCAWRWLPGAGSGRWSTPGPPCSEWTCALVTGSAWRFHHSGSKFCGP